METALDALEARCADAATRLAAAPCIHFVGRGPSLVAAQQAALTFNEGARLPACALAAGAFRHGPLEMCGTDTVVVLLAPSGRTYELVRDLATEIRATGASVVLVTDRPAPTEREPVDTLCVQPVGEEHFPLTAAIVLELLLVHTAARRGHEAGVFKRISKITRRE